MTAALPRYSGDYDEEFDIALSVRTGKEPKHWRRKRATRAAFTDTFRDPARMPRKKEGAGGYIGAYLDKSERCGAKVCNEVHKTKQAIAYRTLVACDGDRADAAFVDRVKALGWRGLIHSSFSHRLPEKGDRYRLVLFPDRAMTLDECETVTLLVQFRIGQDCFDNSSHHGSRTMYRPACGDPSLYEFHELEGDLLDVDAVLTEAAEMEEMTGVSLAASLRARPRPAYAGPTYEGPAFADLPASERAEALRLRDAFAEYWSGLLREALDWPEQHRDDEGRGWMDLAYAAEMACAYKVVCPWFPLDLDEAQDLYAEIVPEEMRATEEVHGDIGQRALVYAAEQPVEPPPWTSGFTALLETSRRPRPDDGPMTSRQADAQLVGLMGSVMKTTGADRAKRLSWAARKAAASVPRGLDPARAIDSLVLAGTKTGLTEKRARFLVEQPFQKYLTNAEDKDENS